MLKYKDYFLRYVVRNVQQLPNRKPVHVSRIVLPWNSLIHYMGESSSDYGISLSHPLLRTNESAPIRVFHIDEVVSDLGNPRLKTFNRNKLLLSYFSDQNKLFTRLKRVDRAMREKRAILVFDYSLIPHRYNYPVNRLAWINEHANAMLTQLAKLKEVGGQRNQFLCFKLPKVLPELTLFKITPNPIPTVRLDDWSDLNALNLFYLWNYIEMGTIDPTIASNITIAFTDENHITQVNLGNLMEWAKEDLGLTRKYLYHAWVRLYELRTVADSEALDGVEETGQADEDIETDITARTLAEDTAELVTIGRLSTAEQNRLWTLSRSYKTIKSPVGEGTLETLAEPDPEVIRIDPAKVVVVDKPNLLDKDMANSAVDVLDKVYLEKVLEKDIAATVLSMQQAGALVTDYKVEEKVDALNHYKEYSATIVPIAGKKSTFNFKLPAVDESGEFIANGVKYRLDKQKGDLPIRKTRSDRVALTSYYGKAFVDRSPKAVNNYGRWIISIISKIAMDGSDNTVTNLVFSSAPLPKLELPRHYTAVAQSILKFTSGKYDFYFGYANIDKIFPTASIERAKELELVICGTVNEEPLKYLGMDVDGNLSAFDAKSEEGIGALSDILSVGDKRVPIEFAEIKVFGKAVPLVLFLGYIHGLGKLLDIVGINHRWVEAGKQTNLESYEYRFRFRNESLVIDTRDRLGALIIGGLSAVARITPGHDSFEFNKKGVYGHVLEMVGLGRHILKEVELMDRMFIDPITKELLQEMKEPVELRKLLIRAAELLLTDSYTDEMDTSQMRIKGYERFSGFVYKRMVEAIRTHRSAPNITKSQISTNPKSVWGDILADQAVMLVEESNPLHNLRERESVTFAGQGGRDAKTMVERTRIFHTNDVGVISESTPDSSKVGIRSYMPPNAKFNSLRGTTNRFDYEVDGATSAISTVALFSPGATHMDAKRLNFVSIQQSSMVSARGGVVTPVRTGYEQVIANRCSDKFAYTARGDGVVTEVTEKYIKIRYKKGNEEVETGIKLGTSHGFAAGAIIPHSIRTDLKVGGKFKSGDAIAWNTDYFDRDYLNPGGVSMKNGVLIRLALMETADTLDDGSVISARLAEELSTPISKSKTLLIDFENSVTSLIKEGDTVDLDSILCIIEDASTATIAGSDKGLLGLSKLSGSTPKAKFRGVVGRIEVIYMGDMNDMHPTLKAIAKQDAKRRVEELNAVGASGATTGEITESTFVGGEKVVQNTMAITILMDASLNHSPGDKVAFDNALKSVVGRVMTGKNVTAGDNEPIDAMYSYDGVQRRIVLSPIINGVTNTTLLAVGKAFVATYHK